MTMTDDNFSRDLGRWLHEESVSRVPDHLGEVLVRTAATRQRPWWSSPERWLPMDTVATQRGMHLRPIAILLLIGALIVAVLGAFYVGTRPPVELPGLADNGRILVAAGTKITSYDADGSNPRTLVEAPAGLGSVSVSPDGQRFAYYEGPEPGQVKIMTVDGSDIVTVPNPPGMSGGDQITWSPDSQQIVYPAFRDDREYVVKAAADGSSAEIVGEGVIDPALGVWRASFSPDGEWISFIGVDNAAGKGTIFLIRPDGTELHALPTVSLGTEPGDLAWSPDPTVQRLLYTGVVPTNTVRVFDVATNTDTEIAKSWWPTWSPDGDRISFWGTEVVDTSDGLDGTAQRVVAIPAWTDGRSCQEHPELKDQSFCGPAGWSPDGSRLIAPDITGTSILSVMADGTGKPIVIPIEAGGSESSVSWQPIR